MLTLSFLHTNRHPVVKCCMYSQVKSIIKHTLADIFLGRSSVGLLWWMVWKAHSVSSSLPPPPTPLLSMMWQRFFSDPLIGQTLTNQIHEPWECCRHFYRQQWKEMSGCSLKDIMQKLRPCLHLFLHSHFSATFPLHVLFNSHKWFSAQPKMRWMKAPICLDWLSFMARKWERKWIITYLTFLCTLVWVSSRVNQPKGGGAPRGRLLFQGK